MANTKNPISTIRKLQLIKPPKLKSGDTIGIIAPSGPVNQEKLDASIQNLKSWGYKIKLGKHVYDRYGYFAGQDTGRAEDFNRMFADPEVNAIFCARGGNGATRIIPALDFQNIRRNPKIFLGYSDITAFLNAIHQLTGLVTFHAPMVESGMSTDSNVFSREMEFRLLSDPEPMGVIPFPLDYIGGPAEWSVVSEGMAEGRAIAGCISVIQTLLGTPYEFDLKNKILFCEDVDEEPHRIDRMLAHLKLTGKLKQVHAVLLGKLIRCEPKEPDKPHLTYPEIFGDLLGDLGIPVVYNLGFGHGDTNFPIPIGIKVKIDTRKKELSYLEGAVV
ncbi:MAG: LD-carboxypeptidase [bacterium]